MKNRWGLLIVLFLAALSVTLSQLKVVPLLGDLAVGLNVDQGQIAWIMSVFYLAGIILAIPGGAILGKLGPKKLLLSLLGFVIVGNIIGSFATTNFPLLLVSRTIEGVAFSMIIMVGIVFITSWFEGPAAGLPIGIFTTFPAFGSIIAYNTAIPISSANGVPFLWWAVVIFTAVVAVLVAITIKLPNQAAAKSAGPAAPPDDAPRLSEVLMSGKIWLLALCQGCVAFILFTYITIYPMVFQQFYGLDAIASNQYASFNGIFGIPFCIIGGFIIAKFKKPILLILICFIGLVFTCFITTHLSPPTYIVHTLLSAVFTGLTISAVLVLAPMSAKRPSLIGYSVALVNTVYFLGMFVGAPAVMGAAASSGWGAASMVLVAVSAIGIVSSIIFLATSRQKSGGQIAK
ncbi:MAG: MFS transporter [Clostridiales Family XIII bacterium]|jgi:predicted MFS family arabinose efflux permease|nr:MFS transporter [Clostridiales Family XIII bacterium]